MIRPVQYLRGVAAMLVVWHHALSQIAVAHQLADLPPFGGYGVDLFFVISGFIMLVTTWDKPMNPMEFMRHRIRRIVPLYWPATLMMIALAMAAPELFKTLKLDAASIAKSLLFVPYYSLSFPDKIEPLLVPGWSLNYEMFFYVLFAMALLLKREWRLQAMSAAIGVLVAIGFIVHPRSAPAVVYTNWIMLEFVAGMILGRLYVMREHARRDGGHALLMGLGDASYSIYLTHTFTLGLLREIWAHIVPSTGLAASMAWMGFALTGCAIAGWCFYWFVERPITLRFKRGSKPELKSAST